jgi:hypothetical protein
MMFVNLLQTIRQGSPEIPREPAGVLPAAAPAGGGR